MERDRLGRRRSPDQGRGLRPLHPALPSEWTSRAIRVAMSEADWSRLEDLAHSWAAVDPSSTQARAYGQAISHLLEHAEHAEHAAPGPLDWMDWERKKTLKLLRHAI
jgi:hypothetical protein